jgi:hypothetical protein
MTQRYLSLVLMLLFPPLSNCQSQPSALAVCEAIISNAAHNVYLNTSSYEYYDSTYDNYCNYDGSEKNQYVNTAAKIVYEGVPMEGMGNVGNKEVSVHDFCRVYSSSRHQRSTNYTQNTLVVEKALQTTADCVHFAASKNSIDHVFGVPASVTLTIAVGSGNSVNISSLGHSPNVTCVGPGRLSNITYGIGTKYSIDANTGTYSIECTRTSEGTGDGGRFYEEASLALTTSAGLYHVYWPQAKVEPERIAEKIAQDIATLRAQINKLQSELAAMGTTDGDQPPPFTRGKQGAFYACPTGQFVSGIGPTEWNSDHPDAVVANIKVQCRKAVVGDSNKQ